MSFSGMDFWNGLQAISYGERLPRKLKKYVLGRRPNRRTLKAWRELASASPTGHTMHNWPNVVPFHFCPKCGCKEMYRWDHGVSYPEVWIDFHCARCNELLCTIDNSRPIHCFEFEDLTLEGW